MSKLRRKTRSTRGAVLVEFMAVFFPLFAFFLGLVQLLFIYTAKLINGHAAMCAARTAMVAIPDPLGNDPNAEIARAARVPLSTLGLRKRDVRVSIRKRGGRDGMIRVRVTIDYPCRVPLGNLIACGGARKTLTASAQMPNQGVDYQM